MYYIFNLFVYDSMIKFYDKEINIIHLKFELWDFSFVYLFIWGIVVLFYQGRVSCSQTTLKLIV